MLRIIFKFLLIPLIMPCGKLIWNLFLFIAAAFSNKSMWRKLKGKWIMITGATDGIGREIVNVLAERGHKLVLVGRNPKKLAEIQSEIKEKVADIRLIECDYSKDIDTSVFDELEIGLLINNIGVSSDHPVYLNEDTAENIIKVNLLGTVTVTKSIVTRMIDKKFGYIVNIGSLLAIFPSPLLSTYCAAKAFIKTWSESLYYEHKNLNVHVECVLPGLVCTKMSKMKNPSLFVPSANTFARSLLSMIGLLRVVTPYFPHFVMANFMNLVPVSIFSNLLYLYLGNIRKFAMIKKKRE